MKALILVGGFGTRLRPLTFSCPKPLVEFANLPIVCHQIEALVQVGVTEIILAIGYNPEAMMSKVHEFEKTYKVKITVSQEIEPLGTAGPLKLAEKNIKKDNLEGLFFVFNSDVTCEFPLKNMIEFHKSHGKEGTILITKVEDPSKFGVVLSDQTGKISSFVEKPKEFVGDRINAGLYIFNTSVIDRIPADTFTMLEKAVFPKMAEEGQLYCQDLPGYWADVGQPKDYMVGTKALLSSYAKKYPQKLAQGENIKENVLIDPSAKISSTSLIGPNVVIGPGCVVEDGVRLQNVVLLRKSVIKSHSWVDGAIIGWSSTVGKWCRVESFTVLGEDVQLKDETFVNGIKVLPHKGVNESIFETDKIIM